MLKLERLTTGKGVMGKRLKSFQSTEAQENKSVVSTEEITSEKN